MNKSSRLKRESDGKIFVPVYIGVISSIVDMERTEADSVKLEDGRYVSTTMKKHVYTLQQEVS